MEHQGPRSAKFAGTGNGEQSVFTPKSTVDRILVLRVLIERRRDFRSWLTAAHLNLQVFGSVN